ncbi:MAG: hybrid sensor histidine kinase/response regulator [Oscillatoriales cyanobacterium]|nr:MAG: hybrid sensor histidine kinase/response regulator [Oscillatoriales cyanobacterium]TAE20494.1 MAG: hybrid sensor histidine kinase/response regulator [Oscillatoriales cyanobacterium]TAE41477.1 MAG: hybrid sensor histidine kinase/response regulator [Oscillatoriales cyanobacterium]TAE65167.1 MAG: hybrid sensor histidine kinase/response regulator [Oscillatoriales cyanobacterium]TAF84457.1 MAG: hybrid sensor histidine kinase/response regulator [Oscillatoriales cyanobacterium]
MMLESDKKFILIVDDSATNLSVLSQALKTAGYKVRVAVDGESALVMLEKCPVNPAKNFFPELILLDVQMPGIDGFETCRRIKENQLTKAIPVIFMTALADAESKMKGLSLGAVDYITKPFEQDEVIARVNIHWRLKELTDNLEQQVTERTCALQKAQVKVVQQEKLSALGQLVAGVAHEINNPLSFMVSNIAPAKEYLTEITELLSLYQKYYPEPPSDIASKIEDIDLEFVIEDFSHLLDSMEVGTERIKDISLSLRNFARSDGDTVSAIELHQTLDSTLLLLKHRLKDQGCRPAIEVIQNYGELPLIKCYPGPMNQVFMNLLANAIDAVEEAWEKDQRPLNITISTEVLRESAIVRIADNGLGMTEEIQQHLFEPLFTTKAVGKGTGLGLSIAKQIVSDKHGGQLFCKSIAGKGTEFAIELPI